MGGKAIKNTPVRRYARQEYLALEAAVLAQLRNDFPGRRVEAVQAYRTKPDFGDMDVLIESDGLALDLPRYLVDTTKYQEAHPNGGGLSMNDRAILQEPAGMTLDLQKYLVDTFGTKEFVPNDNVISFEHREFQIDLIMTPKRDYETSRNYLAWNDNGNLLGRVVHVHGRAKLGQKGLTFPFRNGDYMFEELEIERDWSVILPAFGYDYERWKAGFDTVEDIFRFVVSSPYFNKDIYLLHNRNHKSRVRDAKRKTYSEFLEFIEAQPDGTLPAFPYPEDRYEMLPRLFEALPGFKEKYEAAKARFDAHVRFQERFNGEYVSKLTGRTDKALGMLMKHLREQFPEKGGQRTFVLQASDTELADWVMQAHRGLANAGS